MQINGLDGFRVRFVVINGRTWSSSITTSAKATSLTSNIQSSHCSTNVVPVVNSTKETYTNRKELK